jgi:Fic family protein
LRQTLVFVKWNPIFAWLPIESLLHQKRLQYYQVIEDARKANDLGVFIEFMLLAILDVIPSQAKHQDKH